MFFKGEGMAQPCLLGGVLKFIRKKIHLTPYLFFCLHFMLYKLAGIENR
jgi:hypothetical protein